MTSKPTELGGSWWSKNREDMDREIVRLASICKVRILDPRALERVLRNDPSACGASNPIGFEKLRAALMLRYNVRERAVAALGEAKTAALVQGIVANLRERSGKQPGKPGGE